MNKDKPIAQIVPLAIKWFCFRHSLPKTLFSSAALYAGFPQIKSGGRHIALTFSVSEDYARLWLYFMNKFLSPAKWKIIIVDSAGDMDRNKLGGAQVVRFLNIAHGQKIDIFLRIFIDSEIVFLSDDDKYLISDLERYPDYFKKPELAVVSFCPRRAYRIKVGDKEHLPMGTYGLMLKRKIFTENNLFFRSPKNIISSRRIFNAPGKNDKTFDTGDYANEQLLVQGLETIIGPQDIITGFDSLTSTRLLVMRYGKKFVKDAIMRASQYRVGGAGATIMYLYGIAKFENIFKKVFQEPPKFSCGFNEEELKNIVQANTGVKKEERAEIFAYFNRLDSVQKNLENYI